MILQKKARKNLACRALAGLLSGCLAFSITPISPRCQTLQAAEAQGSILGLTTDYQTNPIGLDTDSIRFGWHMESNRIGAKQSYYQIKVTSDGQDVWDSGKVADSRSTGIPCGASLTEGTSYEWELTVWDEAGASYTNTASFETGVTNRPEWKDASFIRLSASPAAPVFRTEQPLEAKEIKKARLYITALGAYEAYINGNRTGEYNADHAITYHHMNPGYGNGDVSLGYQTYDVTSFLAGQQTAAISVIAGTGWKNGMANTTSQPAVKALLSITYADGAVQNIQTNTTDWKGTLRGGITSNGIYYGEDYNAIFAEALGDFTQPGYDDSKWVNAASSPEDGASIPCIQNIFEPQQASYARILVKETGPADNNRENLLQMMELELLDQEGKNAAAGIVPEISNTWSPNGQWKPGHLTDGDLGTDTDNGYTSQILGRNGQEAFVLESPISITFPLKESVTLSGMKIYPRTKVASVSGNQCANYPKKYCLQVSSDGIEWTTVNLSGAQGALETQTTATWTEQTEANAAVVTSLRNVYLHPETSAFSFGTELGGRVTAKHVRISVSEIGPAVAEDNENRLQIMELELLDGEQNVALNVTPTVSDNTLSNVSQWAAKNMTDGDYGLTEEKGYSTDILGKGETFLSLDNPVTIQFDFGQDVSFSTLKFYPRVSKASVAYGICANYPKTYAVEISDDGRNWTSVLEPFDQGIVQNETLYQNVQMSTTTFKGTIRAQTAIPGRFTEAFDQYPVSAYTYSGTKANSSYAGGEVEIEESYEAAPGQDLFGEGILLKKGQTMIVNLGQNLSAVPQITFSGKRGARAQLNFAEMLNDGSSVGNGATQADGPKGSIYQKSLRGARSAASYIFAGSGKETYQPKMSFFGYQYIQITANDDITIHALCSKAISSVSKQTGRLTTNNETVNKLFSNVLYGQLSNYFTTPTDCNQRDERLSWSGDTQAFAQTAVYNFDSVAFLQEMQQIYNENTWIKGYVPSVVDQINGYFQNWAAGWSDVLIIQPWVLYQQTGDVFALSDNWDTLVHYMDYLHSHERGKDQAPASGNQNYGDWLSFQGTSIEVIYDYYYGYMHQLMAKIAQILGETEKEQEYSQKFNAIKEKFLATHVEFTNGNLTIKSKEGNVGLQFMNWTDKKGVWENNSQTSLLWMLKLGFYDSEEMKEAAERLLLENIKNENPDPGSIRAKYGKNTLAVGFLGSNVIAPVLSDYGHADVSYDLLLQEGQPSWLFEVLAGATTVWERWNSYTPGVGFGDSEMNSFNHYAYGSILEWMYRYMAGISADEDRPGFQNIILQPMLDTGDAYNSQARISSVDSSYDSYYGTICSSWRSSNQELASYHTQIPANTTADLYLPTATDVTIPSKLPKGVTYLGTELHNGFQCARFELLSGGYDFAVRNNALEVTLMDGYQDGTNDPKPPVQIKVSKITVKAAKTRLFVNETTTASATVSPANASNKNVVWSSSDNKIAAVDAKGKITAKKAGTVKITATSADGSRASASCSLTVVKPTVKLNAKNAKLQVKKSTSALKATGLQKGDKIKQWKTSNPKIATVSKTGKISAKRTGNVKITVTTVKGASAACTFRVIKGKVTATKLTANVKKLTLKKGKKYQLKITRTPITATDKLKYTSSKPKVASVNASGKITAKKKGKATITVQTPKKKKVKISVTIK